MRLVVLCISAAAYERRPEGVRRKVWALPDAAADAVVLGVSIALTVRELALGEVTDPASPLKGGKITLDAIETEDDTALAYVEPTTTETLMLLFASRDVDTDEDDEGDAALNPAPESRFGSAEGEEGTYELPLRDRKTPSAALWLDVVRVASALNALVKESRGLVVEGKKGPPSCKAFMA
jgi:hypothetical protein